jgi:hypothetical protein
MCCLMLFRFFFGLDIVYNDRYLFNLLSVSISFSQDNKFREQLKEFTRPMVVIYYSYTTDGLSSLNAMGFVFCTDIVSPSQWLSGVRRVS